MHPLQLVALAALGIGTALYIWRRVKRVSGAALLALLFFLLHLGGIL